MAPLKGRDDIIGQHSTAEFTNCVCDLTYSTELILALGNSSSLSTAQPRAGIIPSKGILYTDVYTDCSIIYEKSPL